MIIEFKVIPHRKQRYDTVGDYWVDGKKQLNIRISKMHDHKHQTLVFLHELIELFMVRAAGIKLKDIDRFDKKYEETRKSFTTADCGCEHLVEPGDDPHCPYGKQHRTATACEKLIADHLGINWQEYEKAIENLS